MSGYKIIDSHAHIFPEKIADKAVESIGGFYDLPMAHKGNIQALITSGNKIGVEKYLVFSTATTKEQVPAINNFIYNACEEYKSFIGLGTLHPDMTDYKEEISRMIDLGFKGVKLHPDFQRFYIDTSQMMPIYKALEESGLKLLCHVGDRRSDYSAPYRLAKVAQRFPKLQVIAPHFGGWQQWDEAMKYLALPNVYFDTSSALYTLNREQVMCLLKTLSSNKFFFGTDFPMWDHKEELERFLALELPYKINEDILYNNFAQLFL
ncbi:amidohydrolase family protein [Cellulosilyticum ruminicola]|uniref:amidohydrolase family protein n=1 Tax=Cellulosilyticum ruminicola TaxID=425254 RepID=UPI000A9E388C|nr:amidohydrolase family protein [Cellulosilyticum ruminicola]